MSNGLSGLWLRVTMGGLVLCSVVYVVLYSQVARGAELPAPLLYMHRNAVGLASEPSFVEVVSSGGILSRLKTDSKSRISFNSTSEDGKCSEGLDVFGSALQSGKTWALAMVDASSKVPSGLLAGNLVDLGAYDQCVDIAVKNDSVHFTGQHCLAVLHLQFQELTGFASPGVLKALGNSLKYTFSLCLPSSCSPTILAHSLSTAADDINDILAPSSNISVSFTVDHSDCHVKERPPLKPAEVIGIVVTCGILLLVVICTVIDLALFQNTSRIPRDVPKCLQILIAFSLVANGRRLLSQRGSEETISALHGLRFLSIAWVVIGHRIKFSAQSPLVNLLKLADYIEDWSSMFLLNATLSVDVFFVISGVLNTYVFLRGRPSVPGQLINYIHRYLRLTPAYAVMILVTGSWLYRTGDGPLWDRLVGDAKDDCVRYWWPGLLYINNYYNPNNNCMMQSWYLAADMQLFWLSPLVLFPLWRWPRVGLLILGVLVIVSLIVPFLVAFIFMIKTPIPISMDQEKVNREMTQLYLPTHTKTVSYVIGTLAGYILYLIRSDKVQFKPKKSLLVIVWAAASVAMVGSVLAGHSAFQLDSPYDRWYSSLYIAFYRFFWSLGVAWMVMACTTGYGGVVNRLLSWKFFTPLGRLTYCTYLTHVAVILYSIGTSRQPQHFSYFEMIIRFLGELVISVFLAAVLSLTIESPIAVLEKILLHKKQG